MANKRDPGNFFAGNGYGIPSSGGRLLFPNPLPSANRALHMTYRSILSVALILMVLAAGCAGSGEAAKKKRRAAAKAAAEAPPESGPRLADVSPDVRTVQLYRTGDERRLPIVDLGSRKSATLAFDIMDTRGNPLSVYFYHADRTWRRDLSPAEYLSSFQRDDLLDYHPSQATDIQYTHYTYQFPNDNIDFRVSGNYILRVTNQGMEDDVLFERLFFVSEQLSAVDFGLDNVLLGGSAYPAIQPSAKFTPPPNFRDNVFNYNVCFVRNGQFKHTRCTDRPQLAAQPTLQFYLEPETSFRPQVPDYFVDIGVLHVGPRIARTDLTSSPYRVYVEPDYAQFAGTGLDPLLSGQIVVDRAVRNVPEPAFQADYVETYFTYVPPNEVPVNGSVVIAGSFNDWRNDPANRMEWIPENRRYEGNVLLKQGQYEYRYLVSDRRVRLTGAAPRLDNLYSVFVYFKDTSLFTDRLLAVNNILTR